MEKNKKVNDQKDMNKIIILITLGLFVILALLTYFGVLDIKMNLILEKQYNISEVNNISLNTQYYDLEIKRTNNSKIVVKYYGNDENNIMFQQANKDLVINMNDNEFMHKNGFLKQRVVVLLPDGYIGNLNISSTKGDIVVRNNYNINLNITTNEGDVVINKITKATIKSGDGDVVVTNARVVVLNSDDGDVILNNIKEELNIKTVDSDVKLNKLNMVNNSTIETYSGDIEISGIKNGKINVDQAKGDLNSLKSYDGDYEMKLITKKGDISIH